MSENPTVSSPAVVSWGRIVFWTILFQIAWNWRELLPVLLNGELSGPDDFLRLHQVLNWMNGQGWYDLTVYRLFPPAGGDIHWSRIVDVPIAGLIWFFDIFTDTKTAAKLTSVLWPTLLMVATVLGLVAICDRLIRQYNRLLVVLFSVLSVSSIAQFVPGRLDHHNLQILLLTLVMLGLVMRPARRADILIGANIALSVSIGLDSAMLFIPILAFLGFEWANGRDKNGNSLARVGLSMAIASLALYAVNFPPALWLDVRCDTNSLVFLSGMLLISAAFMLLAFSSRWLPASGNRIVWLRLLVGILTAACAFAILAWAFPHCANGPFYALSEALHIRWLNGIQEAMSVQAVIKHLPAHWLSTIGYLGIMVIVATIVMVKKARDIPNLAPLYAILLICALGVFYQIRIQRTGIYAAIPFCVMFAVMSWNRLQARFGQNSVFAMAAQALVCVLLLSLSWLHAGNFLFPAPKPAGLSITAQTAIKPAPGLRRRNEKECFSEADYTILSGLKPGLVMIDLDSAMPVLVHTRHSVIGGPYHRNEQAILNVLDFYGSDTETAHGILNSRHVDYVAMCVANHRALGRNPVGDSMAARILRNDLPAWLDWVSAPDARLMVMRVVSN